MENEKTVGIGKWIAIQEILFHQIGRKYLSNLLCHPNFAGKHCPSVMMIMGILGVDRVTFLSAGEIFLAKNGTGCESLH